MDQINVYRRQETHVLAQRPNAAGQANDERDRSAANEYEGGIERNRRHFGQIVKDVLFAPRPEADHQNAESDHLRTN